jgi:hypothetical protein
MKALDVRIVEALREGVHDFVALRRAVGCTASELRAGVQRLRWAGKVEMGALRLAPSMIENSAEVVGTQPPPDGPAEPGPAQRRRAQDGAGAEDPDAPAPTPHYNARGAAALERARARSVPSPTPALAAVVREEAEVQAARRKAARRTGGGVGVTLDLSLSEQVATLVVEEPADAIRVVKRRWPDLWSRVVLQAREEKMHPGPMMFALIERGLAGDR